MRSTFLHQAFRLNRPLCFVLVAFILMQAIFSFKGVETIPFINWGMYSSKFREQEKYSLIQLKYRDAVVSLKEVSGLPTDYLQSLLDQYALLHEYHFIDPLQAIVHRRLGNWPEWEAYASKKLLNDEKSQVFFRDWICRYLQQYLRYEPDTMSIVRRNYLWKNSRFTFSDERLIEKFYCEGK